MRGFKTEVHFWKLEKDTMSEETYEDEITCPKCGFVFDCSYELFAQGEDSVKTDCEECGVGLSVTMIQTIEYKTEVAK